MCSGSPEQSVAQGMLILVNHIYIERRRVSAIYYILILQLAQGVGWIITACGGWN